MCLKGRKKSMNCAFMRENFGTGEISRTSSKLTGHNTACNLLCSYLRLNSVCKNFTHCRHEVSVLGQHT